MKQIQIAAILTVFNRRQKTLACLSHLYSALDAYNSQAPGGAELSLTVFITDDGCTDGTAAAVQQTFAGRQLHILPGTGSLFWAGGMRTAWQAAIDSGTPWDYYLLLNDDTFVYENVFAELLEADEFGCRTAGKHGLSSGITCQPGHPEEITYGGLNFVNKTKGRQTLVRPTGTPEYIDLTHANILLVHHAVADEIGIFYKGYRHSAADQDYGMMAHRRQLPVYSTPHVCGECERDHHSEREEAQLLMRSSLEERKKYVNSPNHSDRDYLLFVKRNLPRRYPLSLVLRKIRLYWPSLYFRITNLRGVYKSK